MSTQLTDQHLAWAGKFCNVPNLAAPPPPPAAAGPAAPAQAPTPSQTTGRPLKSPDELHALGRQYGLDGRSLVCPADADADGEKAFNQGYAEGMLERQKSGIAANIESDLKLGDSKDIEAQVQKLSGLSMDDILDVMETLKKAGKLDDLSDYVTSDHKLVGVAILTIRQDLDAQWQDLVASLGSSVQEAVLKRVPPGSYTGPTAGSAGAQSPDKDAKNAGWSGQQSATLQFAGHWTFKKIDKATKLAPNNPPYDVTFQVQLAANYAGHPDNASGPEVQALIQLGYNETNGQITVLGGVQGALVQSFWNGVVQTQEFVQAVAGSASDGNSRSGQFQAQVGGQVLIKIDSLGVQVGAQIGTGFTATEGSPVDLPAVGGVVIQGNLPGPLQ